ncbi:MAG: hypothetical protein ACRDKT_14230 [Actinomycetota bacterium]
MRTWTTALVALLTLSTVAAAPARTGRARQNGTFVAQSAPFPAMQVDIYYEAGKGSCLDGIEGIHKVSEPFRAPASGTLNVKVEGLSGDWDLYVLGANGDQLAASEQAQVLDGADGEEGINVGLQRGQRVQMVACNWLGEPEITVHFDFVSKSTGASPSRRGSSPAAGSASGRATHEVNATGGPVTPLWQWDPSELEIGAGHEVEWLNNTGVDHHVTPYGGPWKNVDTMMVPIDGKTGFVFRKPGEYLYRCDFAFAGVEHSVLVGDECIGMCGRITVTKGH